MFRLATVVLISVIFAVSSLSGPVFAAPGDIRSIAGGGVGDGIAVNASVNYPMDVAVDSSGNIYIADEYNNRIRKLTVATGTISTVAGNGSAEFSGDGGPAVQAGLYDPVGVALDGAGNLYIADEANYRVRRVDVATGLISTVAGPNSAPGKTLDPVDVVADGSGNLYIADQANHRVWKMDGATGAISAVAGNGRGGYGGDGGPATSATLNNPANLAFDSAGDLYIADNGNHRVRKVSISTGVITTIAGTGIATYSGDWGPATGAGLYYPSGLAFDAGGNLFIADTENQRIRKINPSGTITTVAGNGDFIYVRDGVPATSTSLSYPAGVAVDSAGNVFIADQWSMRIRKVDGWSGIISTVAGNGTDTFAGDGGAATEAALYRPAGAALGIGGEYYIADQLNHRVRMVDGNTGVISTVAGTYTDPTFPGGSWGDGGPATEAALYEPSGVAVDSVGNLYIADQANHRIRKVTRATGIITTFAGNGISGYSGDGGAATEAQLYYPAGVTLDQAGNLYIADGDNHRIRKVSGATGVITTVAGSGSNSYSGDGGAATDAGLSYPVAVALDGGGSIYIADQGNQRVRKVDSATGVITTVAGKGKTGSSGDGGPATGADLNNPSGIAVDSYGHLYIADQGNNVIRRVDADTATISTVAGTGTASYSGDGGAATAATLNSPVGVVVDGAGAIMIADALNHRIRKVEGTGAPLIYISAPSAAITASAAVYYTITYTGADSVTLALEQVTLHRTGTADGTITVSGTGNTTRVITISGITGEGTLGISIAPGTAVYNGISAGAAGPSTVFRVDNIAPAVSISTPAWISTTSIAYTVTYAGADTVTLVPGQVTLHKAGTANGTVSVSGSGTSARTVTISGITGEGSLWVTIAAGSASDAAGNQAPQAGPSPVWNVNPVCYIRSGDRYFCTIQQLLAVYPLADTAYMRALIFAEDVIFNYPGPLTLKGGYDSGFMANSGVTTIYGTFAITAGTVTVENIVVR